MKYSNYVLTIYLLLFIACKNQEKETNETNTNLSHTINPESKPTSSDIRNNLVRSEAPDALTKTEQGYALPGFDDKMAQSPINILSFSTEKNNKQEIALQFNGEINAVENLGHTIQLDFTEGSTTIAAGKTYQFKQLHFHTPSEHLIDGMTFPMEMHAVNVAGNQGKNGEAGYVVIGMLFKMGHENKFIKEFLNAIPREENKKETLPQGTVKLEDMFSGIAKNELETYYYYKGSLTTPPYTESVDWLIRKHIFEASPEQIFAIEKIEGDNARHVQELNQRKVISN
ncbi:MAG TPA: carbonic anhydrase family protein [Chitinophagaceae bacterium]|nr:carbonic anhydrase family protein [Chitinophagaceae bacterium]